MAATLLDLLVVFAQRVVPRQSECLPGGMGGGADVEGGLQELVLQVVVGVEGKPAGNRLRVRAAGLLLPDREPGIGGDPVGIGPAVRVAALGDDAAAQEAWGQVILATMPPPRKPGDRLFWS